MKIRCQSCYRVLNLNEEYCTRCGQYSQQIHNIMSSGTLPFDETQNLKTHLGIYLGFGCFLNGVLYVIFGALFTVVNPGIPLGEIGELLPYEITSFSIANTLVLSGLVMSIFYTLINLNNSRDLYQITAISQAKKSIIAIIIGLIVFSLLTIFTPFSVIPDYYSNFLKDPLPYQEITGSLNYFSLIIGLLTYGYISEIVFRGAVTRYFIEGTVLSLPLSLILSALVATGFEFIAISFFSQITSFNDFLVIIATSLALHLFLGWLYYYNQLKITFNLIFRLLLIIIIIIALGVIL